MNKDIPLPFGPTPETKREPIMKFDDDLQVVFGEVYVPNVLDSQKDFMAEVDIRKMAYRFMINKRGDNVDKHHTRVVKGDQVVESFMVRPGDPDFPTPGAWVVGVWVPNPDDWAKVKKGEVNGFSMDGAGVRKQVEVLVEYSPWVTGVTFPSDDDGHVHSFKVQFLQDGTYVGGMTDAVNGHRHPIVKGTVTELALNHAHRYSITDQLPSVQALP